MTDILTAGNLVLHERVFVNTTFRTVGYVFHQRHADTLQNAAFGLHLRQMRVNRSTAVNRCIEVHYLCLACQQIGFYFGHTGHKRRRGQHTVLLHGFFQSDIVIHHRSGSDIKEAYSLVAYGITHLASVKDNLIRAAFQQTCAKLANLAAQTLCADFYGLTCNICCT